MSTASGAIQFTFANKLSSSNLDTIADFSSGEDVICLLSLIFNRLSGDTDLRDNLVVGSKALDANDYLIFNPSNGILSYDSDGSGNANSVGFVKLTGIYDFDATDLEVISG